MSIDADKKYLLNRMNSVAKKTALGDILDAATGGGTMSNDDALVGRNAGDDADIELIKADSSNSVVVGQAGNSNIISDDTEILGDLVAENANLSGDLDVVGAITCASIDPANGFASGEFEDANGLVITVVNGIITNIV